MIGPPPVISLFYIIYPIIYSAYLKVAPLCSLFLLRPHSKKKEHFYILLTLDNFPCLYFNLWIKSPLLNFGSNQVDFGGITLPASAIAIKSSMVVGHIEKATAIPS